jgi:ribonucleoside-diphosphate reductase alpha chain
LEWTAAGELRTHDEVVLNDHRALSGWKGAGTEGEGYLLGLLIGDGSLKDEKAVLSVWAPDIRRVGNSHIAYASTRASGGVGRARTQTPDIERGSSDFVRGVLRGLFDADGSVQGTQQKGVSVRLAQSDVTLLQAAQRMLLRLGIASTICSDRRPAQIRQMPDGHGGKKAYAIKAQHELVISGDNVDVFAARIGFADTEKADRLKNVLAGD